MNLCIRWIVFVVNELKILEFIKSLCFAVWNCEMNVRQPDGPVDWRSLILTTARNSSLAQPVYLSYLIFSTSWLSVSATWQARAKKLSKCQSWSKCGSEISICSWFLYDECFKDFEQDGIFFKVYATFKPDKSPLQVAQGCKRIATVQFPV